MRVVSADLWEPAPGQVLTWDVTPGVGLAPAAAPITFNQRNHLLGARGGEPSVWITAAFDVDGPVDPEVLETAFRELVARCPGLGVEAVRGPLDRAGGVGGTDRAGGIGLVRHDPARLVWQRHDGPVTRTVEDTREHLVAELGRRCAPFGYPAFLPAAISRPDRSTIVLGMDHLHTDAWSTAVVVDDLAGLYTQRARRGAADPVVATAAPAAAGLVASAAPAANGPAGPPAEPKLVSADDPRLATWHGFLRDHGWALPTFPLSLGTPDGERVPQRTVVRSLADAATADAVAVRAAAAGASTSAAVLATFARAVADLGGPTVLETLLPVHTRTDEAARGSVGWHTTTVPLRIEVDTPVEVGPWAAPDTRDGAGTVTDLALAATGKALRAARELSAVPLEQVLGTLPRALRLPRVDIFQVSYLDYRRLPGHPAAAGRRAHHVSAATWADDLQVWVSRTDDGVAVRARMPRTPTAVGTIDALLDRWAARLADLAPA
ncbi:Condensation domain [Promicromonospora umidemergens]|uniref:Condensation domain-containing protein n=1 Tax=Promicromonospora umidemergens TaxID=629679 RepID=A0ABP8X522_9MICO|nr:hypothetical protein [Promicromonospora umidemergens]MCP2281278.1 Condensation domain [Promicromonospora umidemergens]